MNMIDSVFETIERHGMVMPGDSILACVSGGADSMALLSFLLRYREELSIAELYACHFNHGIRGAESDRDEAMVREYCASQGVRLLCGQGRMREIERPKGESVETFARKLRHAFFDECAQTLGQVKIALAHSKNDLAETVLFNLARGTGIKGMRGILPMRGRLIRPLIEVTRQEIEDYCRGNAVPFVIDSTNESDEYARNRIRHHVLPALADVHNGALDNIARFTIHASELWDFIGEMAARNLSAARANDQYTATKDSARATPLVENSTNARAESPLLTLYAYNIACLLRDGSVVAKYSMKQLLEDMGADPGESAILTALSVLKGELRSMEVLSGLYLRKDGDWLIVENRISPPSKAPLFCTELKPGDNPFLGGLTVCVQAVCGVEVKSFIENSKNILNNSIDCDKISDIVHLRNRRPGDSFRSGARKNTKPLKKLWNERGIPPAERDGIPVVADGGGVVWVMGEGVAERARPDKNSQRIWYIEVLREEQ